MALLKQHIFYMTSLVLLSCIIIFLIIIPKLLIENSKQHFQMPSTSLLILDKPEHVRKLKEILNCSDMKLKYRKYQYGDYWLLENLIRGSVSIDVGCTDTITYTTNGDYTFLEHLPTLLKRWKDPVSFALYAPGSDFANTMSSLQYLRNCLPDSDLIRKYVSFHIFFPSEHMPPLLPRNETEALKWEYDCDKKAPYLDVDRETMYKTSKKLMYPINVGRNIARKAVNTHFILASDVELIPTQGLAQNFLEMIAHNTSLIFNRGRPRVFVLPVFELEANATFPETKDDLKKMLKTKAAIPFHAYLCRWCHTVPKQERWLKAKNVDNFTITYVAKRRGYYKSWEPFYISDNTEPIFDERVTWEGQSNKRIQGYAMCLLDYDYYILHPAFLTHTPGIKHLNSRNSRLKYVTTMNRIIREVIQPEYNILYGTDPECHI